MPSLKIRKFDVNKNLGYLIQQITKDSTQDILAYFYGIASFAVEDMQKKSKASFINKEIILFYKETPISFKIQISGNNPKSENVSVDLHVIFPKDIERHDVTNLINAVLESGLGLSDESTLPEFGRPVLKTPRCLKEIRIKQDEQRTKT